MTDRTVTEDARHEQVLAEAVPSPDIRIPLATVEPEQRCDRVAGPIAAGGMPLVVLDPVPRRGQR
jgi:hypothetical protein